MQMRGMNTPVGKSAGDERGGAMSKASGTTMHKAKSIVAFRNIDKHFGFTHALRDVSFDVAAGSVHALVGENGAGKSTLLNITSGVLPPNSGAILFEGAPIDITSPRKAAELGIGMIHQELAGLEHLTIAENILLGHEARKFGGLLIDHSEMNRIATHYMEQLNMHIAVTKRLKELTVGECQMVEIAKALSLNARLLVMDEPTSALSDREIEALFAVIAELQRKSITIMYISHRLEEIFRICDTITILRDGEHIATLPIKETERDEVVKMMVGEELRKVTRRASVYNDQAMITLDALSCHNRFEDISFSIRKGEVFGLFGLLGSGRSELAHTLYGMVPATAGRVIIDGKELMLASVREARAAGIAYVPEDRKRQGLFAHHSVRRNIIAVIVRQLARVGWVARNKALSRTRALMRDLDVRADSPEAAVGRLSGGNQQKVILSRWIATNPKLLILDEPTRGIDVKAKAQIYELIATLAKEGVSILLISSELPEIFRVSDTIGVLRNGRLTKVSKYDIITMQEVMHYAGGGEQS